MMTEDEEEQTFWCVCEFCSEGFYSRETGSLLLHPVCDRCWKEVHG